MVVVVVVVVICWSVSLSFVSTSFHFLSGSWFSDTVDWASGRASGPFLSDEVLVWLSLWSEVQIVCIWYS